MYGWNERPAKAEPRHFIGGDEPAAVYEIGSYEVSVSGATPEQEPKVTYVHKTRHSSDPRRTLPNMEIADGEIRIPVTDLVGEALKRLDPAELARALWQDENVKREFMYCLANRYSEQGIDDADRRTFLKEIKEAVHSKAVDTLASTWAKMEWEHSRFAHYSDQVYRINDFLRERDIRHPNGELVQLAMLDRWTKDAEGNSVRGELDIGGKCWTEAREYWRTEVAKHFPAPEAPASDGEASQ